ncbi:MAG: carbamoyltransferase HypF [Thermoanaerobaculales bacterium]|nr:carbamoyltransferase HypF [Thermoanaerobaculales bacterium]
MNRLLVRCRGAVQGVGFRPTVHRIATELGLAGEVRNDPEGATAEVEGSSETTALFVDRLQAELPPLARLDAMEVEEIQVVGETGFRVTETEEGRRAGALVPPDAALCADCRNEMADPTDRRHRYVFTTCTNCGPRFSLTRSLPYDRPKTSMSCFPLCGQCRAEYTDPSNRRFHAEPVCCPACGPQLWTCNHDGSRRLDGPDAVAGARADLEAGLILAVKGLGGYQLACRADDAGVVARLRHRKRRPGKPFAVMVADVDAARRLVRLEDADESLMRSARSPVILAPARVAAPVCAEVAPGLDDLGVMIPTTPLHVELFRGLDVPALVMTSANLSDEPICRGNREALDRLAGIADRFLQHDRDVVRRVDDSVVRSTRTGPVLVRRARGWVPEPLPLPEPTPEPLLAVGGHLLVTSCIAVEGQAFLTQHVGDLDSEPARIFHREVIDGLEEFLEVRPTTVVADAHPDYPSTWLAKELAGKRDGRVIEVQHHLAHAAAVLGEHDRFPGPGEQASAITLDGTGWGPDGTAWGGEWLLVDGDLRWRRSAHLEPLKLIGGEQAVREPWRVAVAALDAAGMGDRIADLPFAAGIQPDRLRQVVELAASPVWPIASGAGRVFEAAGALLGLVIRNDWEGEAAARFEALAAADSGPPELWPDVALGTAPVLPSSSLLAAAARRLLDGEGASRVAAGFHATFNALAVELTIRTVRSTGSPVALGGGCLVNRLLLDGLVSGLENAGYEVLVPRRLPPGDGGLAYGQAALGAVSLARGVRPELVQRER